MSRKTTIYLPDELETAVEHEARRLGRSKPRRFGAPSPRPLPVPVPVPEAASTEVKPSPRAPTRGQADSGDAERPDTSGLLDLFNEAEPRHAPWQGPHTEDLPRGLIEDLGLDIGRRDPPVN